jgi:hypothetical protein
LYVFLLFPLCTSCSAHISPWLNHPNCIWWSVQVMKLLIMWSSPVSRHVLSLRSKYSSQYSVYIFLLVWWTKFHAHTKQRVKLWFWLFSFLSFYRHWTDHGILTSWVQVWFVTLGPKYLNFATFPEVLLAASEPFCAAGQGIWWSSLGLSAGSNGWAVIRLAPWGRGQRWSSKRWFSHRSTIWPGW